MNKILKKHRVVLHYVVPLSIAFVFYGAVSYVYYERIASFLFFDEYANIIAGYFMTQGKALYGENFFNHQMLPAYYSYLVQMITTPDSLYQLISYHRISIILISAFFGMLLVLRMRWVGLGFILIYEPIKYYLFGNIFLAESYIVYPLVYLFYLSWQRLQSEKLYNYDYVIAACAAWFIIFNREPYAPLALFLFLFLLLQKKLPVPKPKIIAGSTFLVLTLVTIISVSIPEYFYQVVSVNYMTVFQDQVTKNAQAGLGVSAILFYPFYVFFLGDATFMRTILQIISGVFIVSSAIYLYSTRRFTTIIFIMIILALANVRVLMPGVEFYSAFYQIQWFALITIASLLLITKLQLSHRKLSYGLLAVLFTGILLAIGLNKSYFVFEKQNQQELFTYNYDMFYITGQAIKVMSNPDSRMFVDLSDSLVYFTAGIPSAYPYSVYYPVASAMTRDKQVRMSMFETNPPDFYYTNCLEGNKYFYALPTTVTYSYAPVLLSGNPSCLYVKKSVAQHLTDTQLKELESLRFSIPEEFLVESK